MSYQDDVLRELRAQSAALAEVIRQLQALRADSAPESPNYRRAMAEYAVFDWGSIGAEEIASDEHGVSAVMWNKHQFIRRSGSGRYGPAIWFSRPTGGNGDSTEYARLVTFKDWEAEALDKKLQG